MALDKKVFAISKNDDKSIATGFKTAYPNADGTYTVEFVDGTKITTAPIKGDKGDKGDKFEYSDFTPEEIESLKVKGDQGEKGDTGIGITTITKTSTSGIVDTYTILFDDGATTTFNVINGANITKVSELENDEEFIKATTINLTNYFLKTETYSKSQIDDLLRNVGAGLSVKIVTELPVGEEISGTTIYLINTSGSNYNQYMYIDGNWANLGSTAVDMSSYYNKTQIDTKLEDYVTANRLTNKLDDYVEKDKLAKVGKTNSYNDLDDLPEIPDVSGLKPYVEVLQDSTNTAPVSKVVYDAVQGINTALEDKADKTDLVEIDDTSTTAEDKVWSAKKVNDSLVDKADYKLVVEEGDRYVEDVVTQEINNWLPNDTSSMLVNLKKKNGAKYSNFQLICNKTDSQNWECIVNGANILWKINYVNGVRSIQELAMKDDLYNIDTTSKIDINSDAELLTWLRNHPYKQALLYLQYKSTALGLDEGEFEYFGSRDAGIAKGIFRETYSKSTTYYIEFDLSNTTSLLLRTKAELATMDKVANDFRKTVITNVTGIANGDVAIIPPSGASNYIPINAKPLGTWNTMPILFYNTSDKQYYLHSAGLDVQEYEVEWITS